MPVICRVWLPVVLGALALSALWPGGTTVARAALVTGMADQRPGLFDAALFRGLAIDEVKIAVPWDAALVEDARSVVWLDRAAADGFGVAVALEHGRDVNVLPSEADYERALRALLGRWPGIRTVIPWNEPNHGSQPTAGRPVRAAGFYTVARQVCPGCTVVAGNLLDSEGFSGYLDAYSAALDEAPAVWGLHPYFDATYFSARGIDRVLADTGDAKVWLTEAGGIVNFGAIRGEEQRAAQSLRWLYALAADRPRVQRMYVYQWQAGAGDRFDAGLLRPDGTARAGYGVVAGIVGKRLTPPPGAPPADAVGASSPTAIQDAAAVDVALAELAVAGPVSPDVASRGPKGTVPAAPQISGRGVRLLRRRGLRIRLSCAGRAGDRCAGRLRIRLPWAVLGGRQVRAAFDVASGRTAVIVLPLGPRARGRLSRRPPRAVRVTVCVIDARCSVQDARLLGDRTRPTEIDE